MNKKILVWTRKGGEGKTSISIEIAKRINAGIISNEGWGVLNKVMGKGCIILKKNQPVPNINENIVFDFGGSVDTRLIEVIKIVDTIIVPIKPHDLGIEGAGNTIKSIENQGFKGKIIIIANMVRSDSKFNYVKRSLESKYQYPILRLNYSSSFEMTRDHNASMLELIKLRPLSWGKWYKPIDKQVVNIINNL